MPMARKGIDFRTHPLLVRAMIARYPGLALAAREIFHIGNNFQPLETFHLELNAAGLESAVILPIDATTALGRPVYSNEQIAELCRMSSRLIGFASVDPQLLVTEGTGCIERDVLAHLERLAPKEPPPGTYGYWHNRYLDFDGRVGFNAGDHLKSILSSVSCFLPIENGKLVRGKRQCVYFVEYDGPLARTVVVEVIGEG